jgi:cytochrome c5
MSENAHAGEHESPIKTPKQLIIVILLAFLVPIIGILMIASYITNQRTVDTASPAMAPDAVAKRLKPVGEVTLIDASAPKVARSGEETYKTTCSACHGTGVAGAPKVGDAAAWAPHLKDGQKHVVEMAIKGNKAMPPRGGNPDLSDLDVERAVVHMVNQSGGKFKEPAAPAAAKK